MTLAVCYSIVRLEVQDYTDITRMLVVSKSTLEVSGCHVDR